MCGKIFGALRVIRKWDWAIVTHGNGRAGYYKNWVFWLKMEKCKHVFPAAGFGTQVAFPSPGQPSRQDESTPWGRFLVFTLRVLLCDLEYPKNVQKYVSALPSNRSFIMIIAKVNYPGQNKFGMCKWSQSHFCVGNLTSSYHEYDHCT